MGESTSPRFLIDNQWDIASVWIRLRLKRDLDEAERWSLQDEFNKWASEGISNGNATLYIDDEMRFFTGSLEGPEVTDLEREPSNWTEIYVDLGQGTDPDSPRRLFAALLTRLSGWDVIQLVRVGSDYGTWPAL